MILSSEVACIEDIDELVKLEKNSFDTDQLSSKQFRYFIQQSSALVLATKVMNHVAAAAIVLFRKNSKKARLYSIAVDRAFRQQGIAKHLYQIIEKELRQREYCEIYLEVKKDNQPAIHFYLKNNFEIMGEIEHFYEDGSDAFRMRKILHNM